jgi:hypothetical protein
MTAVEETDNLQGSFRTHRAAVGPRTVEISMACSEFARNSRIPCYCLENGLLIDVPRIHSKRPMMSLWQHEKRRRTCVHFLH